MEEKLKDRPTKKRKERSDKGKKCGARAGKEKENIRSGDEDGEAQQPKKKARHGKSTKKLPPMPHSHSLVESSDDDN